MKNASTIRLVTFDAYNTLFKPKGGLSAQYAHEASKVGILVSQKDITKHFGLEYKKQIQRSPFYGITQGLTTEKWWEELVYATFLGAGVQKQELDSKFSPLFHSLYARFKTKKGYSLFPDVTGTLDDLKKRGFIMGVISNSDERLLNVMASLNLDKYFDFILPSCIAGHEKPSLDIYQKALQLAGPNIDPNEALHVGDDVEKDYFGSVNAGWHGVVLHRSKLSYEDYSPSLLAPGSTRQSPRNIMTLHDLYPLACHICPGEEEQRQLQQYQYHQQHENDQVRLHLASDHL